MVINAEKCIKPDQTSCCFSKKNYGATGIIRITLKVLIGSFVCCLDFLLFLQKDEFFCTFSTTPLTIFYGILCFITQILSSCLLEFLPFDFFVPL